MWRTPPSGNGAWPPCMSCHLSAMCRGCPAFQHGAGRRATDISFRRQGRMFVRQKMSAKRKTSPRRKFREPESRPHNLAGGIEPFGLTTPTRSVDHTYTNFVRCSPLHQQGPLDSCVLHSAMATVEKTVGVPAPPVQSTVIVPPQATRQHPPNEKACCCCPVLHGTSSHVKKVGR